VLNNIPFAIPFDTRVSIFRNFVFNDATQHSGLASSSRQPINPMAMLRHGQFGSGKTRVQVRRGSVAQDGFDRLAEADLKAPIEITFIDQFGVEEYVNIILRYGELT
jgi:ubiquitin-protein ligase E3 C